MTNEESTRLSNWKIQQLLASLLEWCTFFSCLINSTNQIAYKLERLPLETEMFVPTVICALKPELWPLRFSFYGIFFLVNDENACTPYFSPALSVSNLSLCWNQFLCRKEFKSIKTVYIYKKMIINTSVIYNRYPTIWFKLICLQALLEIPTWDAWKHV